MTLNPMYASMGLTVGEGVSGFINAGTASKLASSLQKYRNQMLEITAALGRRAISQNEIATRDAGIRISFALEAQSAKDIGAANVSAAAAGVQGGSVNATMRSLRRSAANAHAARKATTKNAMWGYANERVNLNVNAIMGRDITVVPRASLLSSVVGLGKGLLVNYDDAQPEGDKLGDQLRAWWER